MKFNIVSYFDKDKIENNGNNILYSWDKNFNFVKLYLSLKNDKKDILKDHKVKQGGVYLLFNKLNNHFYVGSTISIKERMKNYLNRSYLNLQQNYNMPISKALLKYNYDSFSLIIIEYLLDSELKEYYRIFVRFWT